MTIRPARLAAAIVVTAALALPGATIAAEPPPIAPPADVVTWQEHLGHMRTMAPVLGVHVRDCVARHGSMSGLFGPEGKMVEMMGEQVRL